MNRDILIPVGAFATIFAATAALILVGYADAYREAADGLSVSPRLAERVLRIHRAVTGEVPTHTASRLVASAHRDGADDLVAPIVWRILLEWDRPETVAAVLLEKGAFDRAGRLVRGWRDAGDIVFGTATGTWTDAELGLFCRWIVSGQRAWDPDAILAERQAVLDRLRARGAISSDAASAMKTRPLVLRPDPVPID